MNELAEHAEAFQNMLVSLATGGTCDHAEFRQLREIFTTHPRLSDLTPRFVRTCRDPGQFWQYIKKLYPTYQERRDYLWNEFRPLIEAAEKALDAPSDDQVSDALNQPDQVHVHMAWSKALERRNTDAEGAITAARTLLESVCKHILTDLRISYDDGAELPKLYRLTAEQLGLAPSQHTEQIFKQILGGCSAVVEGLGAMRNKLSDAHGKGPMPVRPSARHAELAVNLAGAMAAFLVATYDARKGSAA